MALANEHCRRRVKEALGEAYESFVPLRKAAEAAVATRRRGSARHGWPPGERRISRTGSRPTASTRPRPSPASGWARALIEAGRHEPGRALLQQIIDQDAERCTLLDDAQFFIGYSYNLQRDAKAREVFGVLLRDFPYSNHAKQFVGKLPPAGPVTR